MNYILFDLEAVGENSTDDFMEIIEIAAYKVHLTNHLQLHSEYMRRNFVPQCMIVDSFHTYIKPVFHSSISKKLSKLINISMEDLKNGDSYCHAIEDFIKWAGEDAVFVAWSENDRLMIEENNFRHYINTPKMEYVNLQKEYDKIFMKNKRTSLSTAVSETGNEFSGDKHSAADDSYNMLPILQYLIGKRYKERIFYKNMV